MKEVKALIAVVEDLGNQFLEQREDLHVMDTKEILDASVAESVKKMEHLGQEQYEKFVKERLEQCATPITTTIPKNKLPLFSCPQSTFKG